MDSPLCWLAVRGAEGGDLVGPGMAIFQGVIGLGLAGGAEA